MPNILYNFQPEDVGIIYPKLENYACEALLNESIETSSSKQTITPSAEGDYLLRPSLKQKQELIFQEDSQSIARFYYENSTLTLELNTSKQITLQANIHCETILVKGEGSVVFLGSIECETLDIEAHAIGFAKAIKSKNLTLKAQKGIACMANVYGMKCTINAQFIYQEAALFIKDECAITSKALYQTPKARTITDCLTLLASQCELQGTLTTKKTCKIETTHLIIRRIDTQSTFFFCSHYELQVQNGLILGDTQITFENLDDTANNLIQFQALKIEAESLLEIQKSTFQVDALYPQGKLYAVNSNLIFQKIRQDNSRSQFAIKDSALTCQNGIFNGYIAFKDSTYQGERLEISSQDKHLLQEEVSDEIVNSTIVLQDSMSILRKIKFEYCQITSAKECVFSHKSSFKHSKIQSKAIQLEGDFICQDTQFKSSKASFNLFSAQVEDSTLTFGHFTLQTTEPSPQILFLKTNLEIGCFKLHAPLTLKHSRFYGTEDSLPHEIHSQFILSDFSQCHLSNSLHISVQAQLQLNNESQLITDTLWNKGQLKLSNTSLLKSKKIIHQGRFLSINSTTEVAYLSALRGTIHLINSALISQEKLILKELLSEKVSKISAKTVVALDHMALQDSELLVEKLWIHNLLSATQSTIEASKKIQVFPNAHAKFIQSQHINTPLLSLSGHIALHHTKLTVETFLSTIQSFFQLTDSVFHCSQAEFKGQVTSEKGEIFSQYLKVKKGASLKGAELNLHADNLMQSGHVFIKKLNLYGKIFFNAGQTGADTLFCGFDKILTNKGLLFSDSLTAHCLLVNLGRIQAKSFQNIGWIQLNLGFIQTKYALTENLITANFGLKAPLMKDLSEDFFTINTLLHLSTLIPGVSKLHQVMSLWDGLTHKIPTLTKIDFKSLKAYEILPLLVEMRNTLELFDCVVPSSFKTPFQTFSYPLQTLGSQHSNAILHFQMGTEFSYNSTLRNAYHENRGFLATINSNQKTALSCNYGTLFGLRMAIQSTSLNLNGQSIVGLGKIYAPSAHLQGHVTLAGTLFQGAEITIFPQTRLQTSSAIFSAQTILHQSDAHQIRDELFMQATKEMCMDSQSQIVGDEKSVIHLVAPKAQLQGAMHVPHAIMDFDLFPEAASFIQGGPQERHQFNHLTLLTKERLTLGEIKREAHLTLSAPNVDFTESYIHPESNLKLITTEAFKAKVHIKAQMINLHSEDGLFVEEKLHALIAQLSTPKDLKINPKGSVEAQTILIDTKEKLQNYNQLKAETFLEITAGQVENLSTQINPSTIKPACIQGGTEGLQIQADTLINRGSAIGAVHEVVLNTQKDFISEGKTYRETITQKIPIKFLWFTVGYKKITASVTAIQPSLIGSSQGKTSIHSMEKVKLMDTHCMSADDLHIRAKSAHIEGHEQEVHEHITKSVIGIPYSTQDNIHKIPSLAQLHSEHGKIYIVTEQDIFAQGIAYKGHALIDHSTAGNVFIKSAILDQVERIKQLDFNMDSTLYKLVQATLEKDWQKALHEIHPLIKTLWGFKSKEPIELIATTLNAALQSYTLIKDPKSLYRIPTLCRAQLSFDKSKAQYQTQDGSSIEMEGLIDIKAAKTIEINGVDMSSQKAIALSAEKVSLAGQALQSSSIKDTYSLEVGASLLSITPDSLGAGYQSHKAEHTEHKTMHLNAPSVHIKAHDLTTSVLRVDADDYITEVQNTHSKYPSNRNRSKSHTVSFSNQGIGFTCHHYLQINTLEKLMTRKGRSFGLFINPIGLSKIFSQPAVNGAFQFQIGRIIGERQYNASFTVPLQLVAATIKKAKEWHDYVREQKIKMEIEKQIAELTYAPELAAEDQEIPEDLEAQTDDLRIQAESTKSQAKAKVEELQLPVNTTEYKLKKSGRKKMLKPYEPKTGRFINLRKPLLSDETIIYSHETQVFSRRFFFKEGALKTIEGPLYDTKIAAYLGSIYFTGTISPSEISANGGLFLRGNGLSFELHELPIRVDLFNADLMVKGSFEYGKQGFNLSTGIQGGLSFFAILGALPKFELRLFGLKSEVNVDLGFECGIRAEFGGKLGYGSKGLNSRLAIGAAFGPGFRTEIETESQYEGLQFYMDAGDENARLAKQLAPDVFETADSSSIYDSERFENALETVAPKALLRTVFGFFKEEPKPYFPTTQPSPITINN